MRRRAALGGGCALMLGSGAPSPQPALCASPAPHLSAARLCCAPGHAAAELHVDATSYAFSRGPDLIVVVSGSARPTGAGWQLQGLQPLVGRRFCDLLQREVSGLGAAGGCGGRVRATFARAPYLPCPAPCLQYCTTVSSEGTLQVDQSPAGEPRILLAPQWLGQPAAAPPCPGLSSCPA